MRQLTASQKIAQLEHRIAKLEKQAILRRFKEKAFDLLNTIMGAFRIKPEILYGASERDIKKAMRKLEKDPEFKKVLEEAPPRGNLKKIWGYFNIYFSRSLGYTGVMLVILVLGAMIMKFLAVGGFTAGLLLASFLGDVGSTAGPDEYYAKEIAKQRLLDRR